MEGQNTNLFLWKIHQKQYDLPVMVHWPAQILHRLCAYRLIDRARWAADQDKPVFVDGMTAAEPFLRPIYIVAGLVGAHVPFAAARQRLQIGDPICNDAFHTIFSLVTAFPIKFCFYHSMLKL